MLGFRSPYSIPDQFDSSPGGTMLSVVRSDFDFCDGAPRISVTGLRSDLPQDLQQETDLALQIVADLPHVTHNLRSYDADVLAATMSSLSLRERYTMELMMNMDLADLANPEPLSPFNKPAHEVFQDFLSEAGRIVYPTAGYWRRGRWTCNGSGALGTDSVFSLWHLQLPALSGVRVPQVLHYHHGFTGSLSPLSLRDSAMMSIIRSDSDLGLGLSSIPSVLKTDVLAMKKSFTCKECSFSYL